MAAYDLIDVVVSPAHDDHDANGKYFHSKNTLSSYEAPLVFDLCH